jgi:hypothetical protein
MAKKKITKSKGKKSFNKRRANAEKPKNSPFQFIKADNIRNLPALRDFVYWSAISKSMRKPRTQGEFAKMYEVSEDTLTSWKYYLAGFWDEVKRFRDNYMRRYTTEVIASIAQNAIRTGDARPAKLFLQVAEGFSEKIRTEEMAPERELNPEEVAQIEHALTHIGMASIIKSGKELADADANS